MANYTGYGSITLSFEEKEEGNNEKETFEKLVKALNNSKINLNDIKLTIKGKEIKLNDFDIDWEGIDED